MANVSKGAAGEVLAARFLREKGYTVLGVNVRSRLGEIDIIAADGQYIAFVEVKTRSQDAILAPREMVTAAKQQRIRKTAALFLQQHDDLLRPPAALQPRFDVLEIVTAAGRPMEAVRIEHLPNAFEAGDLRLAF